MIAGMKEAHIESVTELHARYLTGLLRSLGLPAIRAFYKSALSLTGTIAFVWLNDGEVSGFVMGSSRPQDLQRRVFRSNVLGISASTFLGIVSNPSVIRWLFASVINKSEGYTRSRPELTYLAVDPNCRRSGIGHHLVRAFGESVRSSGFESYELSVDSDNHAAREFYARNGFLERGEYREFGIDHVRLVLDLG